MNDTPNNNEHANKNSGGNPSGGEDPKLTAYALGELDPQSEDYKTIAAKVADDPALQEQVQQIASLGDQLRQSYDQAPTPGLDDATLTNLVNTPEAHAMPAAPIARIHRRPSLTRRLLPYAGVAACTALATAGVFMVMQPEVKPPAQAQQNDKPAIQAVVPEPVVNNLDPIAQTKEKLTTPMTFSNDNMSMHQVLKEISAKTGVNVVANWASLELVGVDIATLITIQIKDVPAQTLLELTLDQASADLFDEDKLSYRVKENLVQIDTIRSLKQDVETQIYDINPLLAQQTILTKLKGDLFRGLAIKKGYHKPADQQGQSGGSLFGGSDTFFSLGELSIKEGKSKRNNQRLTGMTAGPGSVYEIRELTDQVPNFKNAPGFDLNDALAGPVTNSGGSGGGGQGGLFGDDSDNDEASGPTVDGKPLTIEQERMLDDREDQIEALQELIQNSIGNPDDWLDEVSTLQEVEGKFAIKTTPENHQAIQRLLDKLAPAGKAIEKEDIEKLANNVIDEVEQGLMLLEHREIIREIERERRERFADLTDNPFKLAEHEPLSTFSVDVDTASYAYGRRAIMNSRTLPTPDVIRIEEWINYFDYGYTAPVVDPDKIPNGRLTTAALEKLEAADESFVPFATEVEVVQCPWTEGNQLVRIGIQAMEVAQTDRPPAHLVFLLDVSGSMNSSDKLGLVQQGMPMLLDQLNDQDKVSIVVYAGASGLVLEAAEAADKNKIKEAITKLRAGGSTAGGAGIKLAYDIASKHFVTGGINRVILCTDGDFNVGTSDTDELVELVKTKANPQGEGENKGVYLSVMGFGRGNLNDEMMEKITNAGNGNYHYIDSVNEAVRTMSSQAGSTLVTVAKDVKLQLEFNPARVASYRLIGYENRVLRNEDFNNDTVDAGDIGAGHSVTALYEIVPMKVQADKPKEEQPDIDDLRYQKPRGLAEAAELPELLTLKLRYKPVDAKAEQGTSRKVVKHVPANAVAFEKASEATRFTSSVAAMGMILRGSKHRGQATSHWVVETAQAAKAHDPNGYRNEFIQLATQVGLLEAQRDNAFRKDLVE